MSGMHGGTTTSGLIGGALLIMALAYAVGMLAARRRRRSWPGGRAAFWYAGLAAAAGGVFGPAAGPGFVAHMAGHLLLGMVAPLLLVPAAPGTLALRALPTRHARRLSRILATPAVRGITHPMTAAVINGGGLWLIYTTGLYPAMTHRADVHLLVQAHVAVAGFLLAVAVVGVDPMPHRPSRPVRAAALLAFLAAHAILAKYLYGRPPAGVSEPDGQAGAVLMYYGGDLVHLALVVVFCWQWYDPTLFRVGGRRAPRPWRLPADTAPESAAHPDPDATAPGRDLDEVTQGNGFQLVTEHGDRTHPVGRVSLEHPLPPEADAALAFDPIRNSLDDLHPTGLVQGVRAFAYRASQRWRGAAPVPPNPEAVARTSAHR